MGSVNDYPVLRKTEETLSALGIPFETHALSAHRTPDAVREFARGAQEKGIGVIIAAAGKAAHLAGVIASYTLLPVIGIPLTSSALDGLDALLSTVQMPAGIPVATVAIDGAENAGILAARILARGDTALAERLQRKREEIKEAALQKEQELRGGTHDER